MFEYSFVVGSFNNLKDNDYILLNKIKNKSEKIIIGIYDDSLNVSLTNNNLSLKNRKNELNKNIDNIKDFIELNNENPSIKIKEYIDKNFPNYKPILIPPSKNNDLSISIKLEKENLYFNDEDKKFNYKYENDSLLITRTDENKGWNEIVLGYKYNWIFFTNIENKKFNGSELINTFIPIKYY